MEFRSLFIGSLLMTGLIVGPCFAQDATTSVDYSTASLTDTSVDWSRASEAVVASRLIESQCAIPYSQLSESDHAGGTFWSAQHSPVSAEALAALPDLRAVVALMAMGLTKAKSIEWLKCFKAVAVCLRAIFMIGVAEGCSADMLVQEGADGCLIKPVGMAQSLAAVRTDAVRQTKISPTTMPRQRAGYWNGAAITMTLSRRERQVIEGMADGLLYKEIADRLGMSDGMVHKYQHRAFRKLRVSNRSEAIRVWLRDRNIV